MNLSLLMWIFKLRTCAALTKCVSPPYTSMSSSTKISQNGANWNSSERHRMKSCSVRTFSAKLHHIANCNFKVYKKKSCFHLNFVIFWINRIIRTSWKEENYKVVTRKEKDLFAKCCGWIFQSNVIKVILLPKFDIVYFSDSFIYLFIT